VRVLHVPEACALVEAPTIAKVVVATIAMAM
jgi:hypothetical protein